MISGIVGGRAEHGADWDMPGNASRGRGKSEQDHTGATIGSTDLWGI